MPTTAASFAARSDYVAHDQVYGTDVDRWELDIPASGVNQNTEADFGAAGIKDIVFDPNSLSTVSFATFAAGASSPASNDAILDDFGWAINEGAATPTISMESAAAAKRKITAGTWTLKVTIGASIASLNGATAFSYIYRVATAPGLARTRLMSGSVNLGLLLVGGGVFTISMTGQPEILFEADETLHTSVAVRCTGQLGGLEVYLRTGSITAIDVDPALQLVVPTGVRTRYLQTANFVLEGATTLIRKTKKPLSAAAEAAATLVRRLTLFRALTAAAEGAVSIVRKIMFGAGRLLARAEGAMTLTKKTSLGTNTFPAIRAEGVVTLVRKTIKSLTTRAEGKTTVTLFIRKSLTASAEVAATLARRLQFARTLSAAAEVKAKAWVTILFEQVPGSIQSVIRRVTNIWED